jgi:hypothetical protein
MVDCLWMLNPEGHRCGHDLFEDTNTAFDWSDLRKRQWHLVNSWHNVISSMLHSPALSTGFVFLKLANYKFDATLQFPEY